MLHLLRPELNGVRLRPSWVNRVPGLVRTPIFSEGAADAYVTVYKEKSREYLIQSFDIASGRVHWETGFVNGGYGSPALTDRHLVALTNFSDIVALERSTGRIEWTFQTKARVRSSIAGFDDRVVFSSGDKIFAIDPEGRPIWQLNVPGVFFFGRPELRDGSVFSLATAADEAGISHLVLYRLAMSGRIEWRIDLGPGSIVSSDTSGLCWSAADEILFGGPSALFVIDASIGKVIWTDELPGNATRQALTCDGGTCFWSTIEGWVGATSLTERRKIWTFHTRDYVTTPISLLADSVLFAADGWLYQLSRSTGQLLDRIAVGHSPYSALCFPDQRHALLGGGEPPSHGLLMGFALVGADEQPPFVVDAAFGEAFAGSGRLQVQVEVHSAGFSCGEAHINAGVVGDDGWTELSRIGRNRFAGSIRTRRNLVGGDYLLLLKLVGEDGIEIHKPVLVELAGRALPPRREIRMIQDIRQSQPNMSGAAIAEALLSYYGDTRKSQEEIRRMIDWVRERSDYEPFNVWRLLWRRVLMSSASCVAELPEFDGERPRPCDSP